MATKFQIIELSYAGRRPCHTNYRPTAQSSAADASKLASGRMLAENVSARYSRQRNIEFPGRSLDRCLRIPQSLFGFLGSTHPVEADTNQLRCFLDHRSYMANTHRAVVSGALRIPGIEIGRASC